MGTEVNNVNMPRYFTLFDQCVTKKKWLSHRACIVTDRSVNMVWNCTGSVSAQHIQELLNSIYRAKVS